MAVAIYPSSFDPIILGHIDIIARAAARFDKLIVAIYERPAKTVLFSIDERVAMAKDAVNDLPNVIVLQYAGEICRLSSTDWISRHCALFALGFRL